MTKEKGLFISFEGIDGSGKSTHIKKLANWFEEKKCSYILLREPGGTQISEAIREILLQKKNQAMCPETELLLFAAARAQIVREVIIPRIQSGINVICDRFFDSTFAYQGYGRRIDLQFIQQLNQYAAGGITPDVTFWLDISVDQSVDRLNSRTKESDRLDLESRDFMQRIKEGYEVLERTEKRVVRINATRSKDVVAEDIRSKIKEVMNETGICYS